MSIRHRPSLQLLVGDLRRAEGVQQTLMGQRRLALRTLDVAGRCVPARGVGGDYYDFIDLGAGRAALVLGDICGKGICAALLMASLQALLRSQCASGAEEPIGLLTRVNRLFCQSTGGDRFATLFFGVYDDGTRQLDYVNCGHNAPFLRRDDGTVQVLDSTATVLGLFKDWSCEVRSIHLQPGDTLIMFSDGAVDAVSPTGTEFGEQRLMAVWQEHLHLDIERLVEALCTSVQVFSGASLSDDLTMVIARAS
jgi:serine phosphatase RsbU (regulator of sigma subunit)